MRTKQFGCRAATIIGLAIAWTSSLQADESVALEKLEAAGATISKGAGGAVEGVEVRPAHSATEELLKNLSQFPKLKRLRVDGNYVINGKRGKLTSSWFAALGGLTELEEILTIGVELRDEDFVHLKPLTSLKSMEWLHIFGKQFNGSGMEHLVESATSLVKLTISSHRIDDEMMAIIGKFPSLQFVELAHPQISDKGVAAIAHLPNLLALKIRDPSEVTGACVASLAKLPKLQEFGLISFERGVNFDDWLKPISAMHDLIALKLKDTPASDGDLKKLYELRPDLKTTRPKFL